MESGDSAVLIVGFFVSWFLMWFVVVRPICTRLDRVIIRLANLDDKTPGKQTYPITQEAQ
jgi:hypothetical protein